MDLSCQRCDKQFDRRGSRARRLCRSCVDWHKRNDVQLPAIHCADCDVAVPPSRGFRDAVRCDPCQGERDARLNNERARERRAADPEFLARQRAAGRASAAKRSPEQRRNERVRDLGKKFGLLDLRWEQVAELLERQGYKCLICAVGIGYEFGRGTAGNAHLDHCHRTGVIRGWLCGPCNRGLGAFSDNPEFLRAAADYLDSRRGGVELVGATEPGRVSTPDTGKSSRRLVR